MALNQVPGNAILVTAPTYADTALTSTARSLAKIQGEAAQSNVSYINAAGPAKAATKIDDAAQLIEENVTKEVVPRQPSNSQKFSAFVQEWGNKAVASGQISSIYFDTYKYILQIPPPPDSISKSEFSKYIDNTASVIFTWYRNARYSGNLGALFSAINQSKPTHTPVDGFQTYHSYYSYTIPPISIEQTGLFILIVSLGLTGILAWKLGGNTKRR